ncbi:MAG: hypothetical protein ABJB47_16755 [Actinomycetota bacterium]
MDRANRPAPGAGHQASTGQNWLRAADPGLSLIAPDLRGRGDSVAVQGPSSIARLARLGRDWASVGEYAAFFTGQTAPLLDPANPLMLDYLAHDLDGHQVRLSGAALTADATDIFFGPSSWDQLRTPARPAITEAMS